MQVLQITQWWERGGQCCLHVIQSLHDFGGWSRRMPEKCEKNQMEELTIEKLQNFTVWIGRRVHRTQHKIPHHVEDEIYGKKRISERLVVIIFIQKGMSNEYASVSTAERKTYIISNGNWMKSLNILRIWQYFLKIASKRSHYIKI